MIQELKIRNFKSFRDEVELSFEPSEDDRYNSVVVMPDGVKLLHLAVVLGANASGKSNLLDAVEFLRRFWNTLSWVSCKSRLKCKKTTECEINFRRIFLTV